MHPFVLHPIIIIIPWEIRCLLLICCDLTECFGIISSCCIIRGALLGAWLGVTYALSLVPFCADWNILEDAFSSWQMIKMEGLAAGFYADEIHLKVMALWDGDGTPRATVSLPQDPRLCCRQNMKRREREQRKKNHLSIQVWPPILWRVAGRSQMRLEWGALS